MVSDICIIFATELRNRVINNKNQLRIMENFKNININSSIVDVERVEKSLYSYLYDRIWADDELLDGFFEDEIKDIIVKTMDKFGDEINKFVGVALEKVANEKLNENE